MNDIQSGNGVYTKTGAYNFLKELLGVPKKEMINKRFFNLFFLENEGFYIIKKPEEVIRNIIRRENISEMNERYYEKKKENKEEAGKIARQILEKVAISLANAA